MADVEALPQFADGDNFLIVKLRVSISALSNPLEVLCRNIIHEELQHLRGQGRVAALSQGLAPVSQCGVVDAGVSFRQVEPTIRGQTSKEDIRKGGGLTGGIAGRNVLHPLHLSWCRVKYQPCRFLILAM